MGNSYEAWRFTRAKPRLRSLWLLSNRVLPIDFSIPTSGRNKNEERGSESVVPGEQGIESTYLVRSVTRRRRPSRTIICNLCSDRDRIVIALPIIVKQLANLLKANDE